ncbi:hypothetical protein BKA59DRAFT_518429 [Fusarium tricinctum]|uniref:Uncharacterized protein n=1 Tax=Fusarium tricinctum TaxID=61284 RepID=A0A8K0RKX6_9HYPO|nr:hypothetical protein BKA59DRAFT_518429 [Fusarium tricinctum]
MALPDMSQPKANDTPPDLDTSIFTFEDASEDIIAASHGQQLPDHNSRYEQRKLLRFMFPNGKPGSFWFRRLRSRGHLEEPGSTKLIKPAANHDGDQFHRELDRSAQALFW